MPPLDCHWAPAMWLIFSGNVYNPLIYYSHFVPLISALLLGFFVLLKDRHTMVGRLFFLLTLIFSLWVYFDLILWATEKIEYEMFFWSIMVPIELLLFLIAIYLHAFYLRKNDVRWRYKLVAFLLFLPLVLLAGTRWTLVAFDYTNCDRGVIEGPLCTYLYVVEGLIFVAALVMAIYNYRRQSDKTIRKQNLFFSLGILFFMGLFILGNMTLISNMGWDYEQYKLFGMIGFLAVLVFLIVRFKAFDIKLLGAQALIWSLLILIGAQFLYVNTMPLFSIILNAIALTLSAGIGLMVVRSVKKEISFRESLEIANRNQESLIHFVSHQLKGFFTKSKMIFSGFLEGDFGDVSPVGLEMVKTGLASDNNAVAMIQDILGASNLKTGKTQYVYKTISLNALVSKICGLYTIEMNRKGLQFETVIAATPMTIAADETQITQVFKNLLDNAIKYSPAGTVKATLQLNPDGTTALFSLTDTGVGLTDSDKKRLFTEGGKGEESLKFNTDAAGYGLYIIKNIVETHKGRIWATSAGRGHGSTFCVELPLSK